MGGWAWGASGGTAGGTGGMAGDADGTVRGAGGAAGDTGGSARTSGGSTAATVLGRPDSLAAAANAQTTPGSSFCPASPLPLSSWILADRQRRERDEILLALRQCGGSRTQAARLLGVSRSTLWRKMQALGILIGPKAY